MQTIRKILTKKNWIFFVSIVIFTVFLIIFMSYDSKSNNFMSSVRLQSYRLKYLMLTPGKTKFISEVWKRQLDERFVF